MRRRSRHRRCTRLHPTSTQTGRECNSPGGMSTLAEAEVEAEPIGYGFGQPRPLRLPLRWPHDPQAADIFHVRAVRSAGDPPADCVVRVPGSRRIEAHVLALHRCETDDLFRFGVLDLPDVEFLLPDGAHAACQQRDGCKQNSKLKFTHILLQSEWFGAIPGTAPDFPPLPKPRCGWRRYRLPAPRCAPPAPRWSCRSGCRSGSLARDPRAR